MSRPARLVFALLLLPALPFFVMAEEEPPDPSELLPRAGQVKGWSPADEPKVYEPDNLFEYINGAAETYLDYGFVILGSNEFRPEGGGKRSVVIDIYDMGRVSNAFGIYSNGAFADANYIALGTEGYLTESSADFFKDRYYVKVTGYGKPKEVQGPVHELAKAVAVNIKTDSGMPKGLAILPTENRIPHSLKYFRNNALGQSFLKDAFQASYKLGTPAEGEEPQLIVANLGSAEAATKALARFKAFMAEGGKVFSETADGFVAEDPYYKRVTVKVHGQYFLCMLKSPEAKAADVLIAKTIENLGKP